MISVMWTSVTLRGHQSGVCQHSVSRLVTVFDDWDTQCPTPKTDRYLDRETGEIIGKPHTYWSHYLGKHVDAPCDRNGCPACAVRMARRSLEPSIVTRPHYVLSPTLVGTGYQDIRKRLGRFFDALRTHISDP